MQPTFDVNLLADPSLVASAAQRLPRGNHVYLRVLRSGDLNLSSGSAVWRVHVIPMLARIPKTSTYDYLKPKLAIGMNVSLNRGSPNKYTH